jgi:hypothetical protein
MKRTWWMKQVGFCFVAVVGLAMLAGAAWADPTGGSDVPQILNVRTFKGEGGSEQRTFLTTDPVTFEATYYDPFPGCADVAPAFVQWFVFNLEGEFKGGQVPAGSDAFSPGSKYRLLFKDFDADFFAPGQYRLAFLVRSCDDEISVVLPEFPAINVFPAP